MAHTTRQKETVFIHNSDMSGKITIKNTDGELNVIGEDVINFILEYIRSEKISELENMSQKQLKISLIM